jgi:hypothetical protein
VIHGFRVGNTPSSKINFYVPGAMVGYFDELAGAIATGNADDASLGLIADRYSMEIVGPVPEDYL